MGSSRKPRILFLTPYPFGRVASQRFRFEQYWDVLSKEYELKFQSFLSERSFNSLYKRGRIIKKAFGVICGFIRRFFILFQVNKFDFIFIHREASPIGPPVFEWFIARVFQKQIIYDFDDAIWLSNTSNENRIAAMLKCHWKVKYICSWSQKVTCGNDFLCDYARKFNSNTIYVPTTLDMEEIAKKSVQVVPTIKVLGWTGTHSTLKYLGWLIPVLQKLQKLQSFRFIVIADKDPKPDLEKYSFIPWNKATEWEDLATLDIGLMPLEQTEWEEGKCGFKALQYMALGIPAIASPTDANNKIITDSLNGFICESEQEWENRISSLLIDEKKCELFSNNGRKKVEDMFSKMAWKKIYLSLFKAD